MANDEWNPLADPAEAEPPEAPRSKEAAAAAPATAPPSSEADFSDLEAEDVAYGAAMLEGLSPGGGLPQVDSGAEQQNSLATLLQHLSAPEEGYPDEAVDVSRIDVESTYDGPVYRSGEITAEFCRDLMQWQKEQKTLAKRYAYSIVVDVIELLKGLTTLVDVEVPTGCEITICGDVHGQYYDLLNIWDVNGEPSEDNPYLFNGDFVDRGSFSVEVILALFSWKLVYPQHLHLARGNHESRTMNLIYGFMGEVKSKYDVGLYSLFCEAFCLLPLCHVINRRVFVVHGGLFSDDHVTLDDIRGTDRVCEPPDEGLMVEMLWSDPQPFRGRAPSKRGVGIAFGRDVTDNFLEANGLELVIRSHEMCEDGYAFEHGGKLITVFSAPNYCDQMGNKGAFIRMDGETLTPRPCSFNAVPHPPVKAMQYANPLPFLFGGL